MKKETKCYFIVNNPVFQYDTVFSFGQTDEELRKKIKGFVEESELDVEYSSEDNNGYCRKFKSGILLMMVRTIPRVAYDFGVLAHEIFHSVEMRLSASGVEFNQDMINEPLAYCIQYTTEQCYKKLNKYY